LLIGLLLLRTTLLPVIPLIWDFNISFSLLVESSIANKETIFCLFKTLSLKVEPFMSFPLGKSEVLGRAFSDADFLSVHVPLTDRTRSMLGQKELLAMPKGSYLINTARAVVVEHDALVSALQSGHLGGAAFDVHYTEPVNTNEVLRNFDNFLATPHVGGASRLNVLRDIQDVLQNCNRFYP
jgi:lactate dehydrogenase-like 2-hydroxyacid dehydrogenase